MFQNSPDYSPQRRSSFSTSFLLRSSRKIGDSGSTIFIRITIDRERVEFSTKFKVDTKDWNGAKGRVKGNSQTSRAINDSLSSIETDARVHYNQLLLTEKVVQPMQVKDAMLGLSVKQYELLTIFDEHVISLKQLGPNEMARGTVAGYVTTRKHLATFIKAKSQRNEIYLIELDYCFIEQFEHYLLSVVGNSINGTTKHLQRLKAIVYLCIKRDYLAKDPFGLFKIKKERVEVEYLTEDELMTIMRKNITNRRTARVRDTFLFSCFTGLSYSDLLDLRDCQIKPGPDGSPWLYANRNKTGTTCNVPLIDAARRISEKYKKDEECMRKGQVVPVLSNQRLNSYLKEIADVCGIEKNLTMHIGRHTFATTVCLTQGVPIETVSKMLGHRSLKTTQIYAKVIEHKVAQDMEKVRGRFNF